VSDLHVVIGRGTIGGRLAKLLAMAEVIKSIK